MEGAPKVWTLTPKIICQKFTFLHVLQKIAVESNLQMKFPACEGSRAEENAWTQTKELLYLTPIVTHGRSGKIQGENRNASFSAHTGPALSSSVSNTSQFSSVHSVVPNSLHPHGLQHTRLPCPSPTSGIYSNSCLSSWWCHPTISSSVTPFSSCLQSFPESGSFPRSQFFTSGGQNIGASALASVLPMNIRD